MGFSRHFDGVDDNLYVSIGGTNLTGDLTMAALYRGDSSAIDTIRYVISNVASTGTLSCSMYVNGSQKIQFGASAGTTTVNEDEWVIIAITKAAGTTTPRGHIYQGGSWTHENHSSTAGNPASQAGGTVRFGDLVGIAYRSMDLAVVAEWQANLTDAQIESMQSWDRAGNWGAGSAPDPDGLWSFQQEDVTESVVDLTGGGADQTARTGTTVITDGPESFYYKTQPVGGTVSATTGLTRTVLLRSDG
jgi:hypothetical protein